MPSTDPERSFEEKLLGLGPWLPIAWVLFLFLVVDPVMKALGALLGVVFLLTMAAWPIMLVFKLLTRNVEYPHRRAHLALSSTDQHRLFADHFRREPGFDLVDTAPDGRPSVTVTSDYAIKELWRVPVPIEKVPTGGTSTTVRPAAGAVPEGAAAWLIPYDARVRDTLAAANRAQDRQDMETHLRYLEHLKNLYRASAKPELDPSGTRIQAKPPAARPTASQTPRPEAPAQRRGQ